MPNTGHRGQMSAEPMSELNSDVIDEERSGMVCRTMNAAGSPIISGIKEEERTCLLGGGAGRSSDRSSYRGIDRAKGIILNSQYKLFPDEMHFNNCCCLSGIC